MFYIFEYWLYVSKGYPLIDTILLSLLQPSHNGVPSKNIFFEFKFG